MIKSKAQICSKILEKKKRIASLESDSFNLSQTLELIQQEKSNLSAKVLEKRAYYTTVIENMNSKLQEQKDWLNNKQRNEPSEGRNMETDVIQGEMELISDFVVCEEGSPFSPELARILLVLIDETDSFKGRCPLFLVYCNGCSMFAA